MHIYIYIYIYTHTYEYCYVYVYDCLHYLCIVSYVINWFVIVLDYIVYDTM